MTVPKGIGETFAFFANPRNLSAITPPWLNFTLVTRDPRMRKGAVLDYRIRWLGIPMRWKSVIASYSAPFSFTDSQEQGPYKKWIHVHTFQEAANGTRVADQVDYQLPFRPLGALAHPLVARQLREIFEYRQSALATLLGGAGVLRQPEIVLAEESE